MLHFNSESHLKQYFSDLNDYLFVEMKAYDTDSLLGLIEAELNFSSLRPILDPDVFPNDRTSEDDFLKDEVRMSLLNPDFQLTVEDFTYTYYSENTVLKSLTSDAQITSQLAAIEKGNDELVPVELLVPEIEVISNKHQGYSAQKPSPSGQCEVNLVCNLTPAACIPGTTTLSSNAVIRRNDGTQTTQNWATGDWIIDWGDGSFSNIDNQYSISLTHMYAQFGTYHVWVYQTYEGACFGANQVFNSEIDCGEVEVGQNNCTDSNCSDQCHVTDANYKLRGETWFKNDMFGNHQVAKTTSYQWKAHWLTGETNWWKDEAVVNAQLNYDFRDDECDEYGTGYHGWSIDQDGNKKSIRASKTLNGNGEARIADEQVHGYFWLSNDGYEKTCSKVLNVCQ